MDCSIMQSEIPAAESEIDDAMKVSQLIDVLDASCAGACEVSWRIRRASKYRHCIIHKDT